MNFLSKSRFALVLILGLFLSGSGFADDKKAETFFMAYAPKTNGAKLYYRGLKTSVKKGDAEYRAILGKLHLAAEQAVKDAEEADKAEIQKDANVAIEIWSFKYGRDTDTKAAAAANIIRILKGFKGEKDEAKPVIAIRGFRAAMNDQPKDLPVGLADMFTGKSE